MPPDNPTHRCFSERMPNPFHGLVQVVETAGAEAVSRDGRAWTLYVRGETQWERQEDGRLCPVALPDVRYGTWSPGGGSPESGLHRAPVRSILDRRRVEFEGGRLLAVLEAQAPQIPFPPQDRFERWLLDRAQRPLALLESRIAPPTANDLAAAPVWSLGHQAPQGFAGLPEIVRRAAGPTPRACWVERPPGQPGQPLAGPPPLPAAAFPELLLAEEGLPTAEGALVRAYLEWLAPWLLQLHDLRDATRARLERAAWANAPQVAACHRLYPRVLDRPRLTAALVEAELRRATCTPEVPSNPAVLGPANIDDGAR
jgi:hypothetical protein